MEIRKFVEKCVAIAAVWIANLITRIANVTKIALFCTNYAGTNDKIIICSIKPVLSSAQQLLAFHSHLHFFFFYYYNKKKKLLHSLGLVYKSMRGMVTNSIDRDQWLNVTSESRDRI
jgi:hypothetical protein